MNLETKKTETEAKKAKKELHLKYAEIKRAKSEVNSDIKMSPFYEIGPPFVEYMRKVQALSFKETPNYDELQNIFTNYLKEKGQSVDSSQMDWMPKSLDASVEASIDVLTKLLDFVDRN